MLTGGALLLYGPLGGSYPLLYNGPEGPNLSTSSFFPVRARGESFFLFSCLGLVNILPMPNRLVVRACRGPVHAEVY